MKLIKYNNEVNEDWLNINYYLLKLNYKWIIHQADEETD